MKLYTNPTLELKDRTNRMSLVGWIKANKIHYEEEISETEVIMIDDTFIVITEGTDIDIIKNKIK